MKTLSGFIFFKALITSLILFSSFGCGYMRIKNDDAVIAKKLQGGWSSADTAIFIGCDGRIDFKRTTKNQNPTDVFAPKYDFFEGGDILKIENQQMDIRTLPGVHETIPVNVYPHVQEGHLVMTLGETTWTLTRPLKCGENVGQFVNQFFDEEETGIETPAEPAKK